MLNVYIIAPDYLHELSQGVSQCQGFKVQGASQDMSFLKILAKEGKRIDSDLILLFQPSMTQAETQLLIELATFFSEKILLLVIPEDFNPDIDFSLPNILILQLPRKQPQSLTQTINQVSQLIKVNNSSIHISHQPTKKNTLKVNKKNSQIKLKGTIGVTGVTKGVGTTHSCILLATQLAKNHKVALVEYNDNPVYPALFPKQKEKNKGFIKGAISRVHYYSGINLVDFYNTFKEDYEVVIIDFGEYDLIYERDYFYSADKKVMIASGIDWNLESLEKFYKQIQTVDTRQQWYFGIPLLKKKYLKDVAGIIDNPIFAIPYQMNPFKESEDMKELISKMFS